MSPPEFIDAVRVVKRRALPQRKSPNQLSTARSAFVAAPTNRSVMLPRTTSGLHTRMLLNSGQEESQIVVVPWSPGSRRPIHGPPPSTSTSPRSQISSSISRHRRGSFTACPRGLWFDMEQVRQRRPTSPVA